MPTTTTGVATEFISFTRASNATVVDSNGLIDWAAHNILLASEQFDASNWSKNAATVAANAIAAPNGTTTADTITSTGSGSYVLQSYSAISGTVTVSVFAKPGTNSSVVLRAAQAGNGYETSFTLSGSGTAGTPTIVGTGGTVSGMTAAISSLANSWYLCSITFAETSLGNVFILQSATSGTIHLWGAALYRSDLGGMQANTSAYPMYNPTTPKNLLGYTENFENNAFWSKINGSVTANIAVALNGLQTADLFVPDSTSGGHYFAQNFASAVNGTTYVASTYVKPAGYSKIGFRENTATGAYVTFNLSGAGSVISNGSGGTGTITALSDGWYRISMSAAAGATTFQTTIYVLDAAYSTGSPFGYNWSGNGTSGVYVWGAQLSDSASLDPYVANHFTAPSAAAYYGPRRDFDGSTLACKGLLVEEQRANLQLRSEEFDVVGTWGRIAVNTPSANVIVSPSGAVTGDIFTEDSTTAFHGLQSSLTLTAVAHTYSVYVKQAFGSRNVLLREGVTTGAFAAFNVTSGTVVGSGSGGVGTITPAGNGWFRCAMTFTAPAGSNTFQIMLSTGTTFVSYAGDGTSGVAVWGAQVEVGSFATSYIPTTTATATRLADVAQVSTAAFPYSATEGTLVAALSMIASRTQTGYPAAVQMDAGSGTAYIAIRQDGTSDSRRYGIVQSPTTTAAMLNTTAETLTANTVLKAGLAFKENDFAFTRGSTLATNSSGLVPGSLTTMRLGNNEANIYVNCHIRQITYLPRRISNAELQTRTS
jgi:hypothetical protein